MGRKKEAEEKLPVDSLGIDIGSSAVKCSILDKQNEKIYENAALHHGNVRAVLLNRLKEVKAFAGDEKLFFSVTGEQAKGFNELLPYFINEIPACVEGCLIVDEKTGSIIEIGAQNAKFITGFSMDDKSRVKFATNTGCSAGTGSFLEEQASRLDISLENLSDYADQGKKIIRMAGRCSVFSKTDMIHHQQEGAAVEDILLGLIYAMVRNYKANVVRKMKISFPVMLVGGVMHIKRVKRAVEEIFRIPADKIILSQNYNCISAMGSAYIGKKEKRVADIRQLISLVDIKSDKHQIISLESVFKSAPFDPPLSGFGNNDGIDKHLCRPVGAISVGSGSEGFLGIDVGSTSINLALINDQKEVLAYRYLPAKGKPEKVVKEGLDSIKQEFGDKIRIKGIGTTGSGRYLIGKKLNAEVILNEITAQAEGALNIHKDVETIFEIGGQDSKFISLENGAVVDFAMNKICAAGTGSFIEEQTKKMGIDIEKCGEMALSGDRPVNLGERCTVFIEGSITKALSMGEEKNNIIAGLCYSIVKNYLNKVVGNRTPGSKILLQGGIAHNQGVVNAFRALTGKEIIVPDFFSVTGAYGIAVLTLKKLQNIEKKEIAGKTGLNIFKESEKLFLKGYSKKIDKKKKTVGIPRVLFLHNLFVLFNVFFKSLGFNVVLSDTTNKGIVNASQELATDETCYPVKLINGHVASLIDKGVDYIFLPSVHTMKHANSKTRQDYACVYMQTASKLTGHKFDAEKKNIQLLSPEISFKFGKIYMAKTLLNVGVQLGKNRFQTALALQKGVFRFLEYKRELADSGKKALAGLTEDDIVFVIITRPYGVTDPELNKNIPYKLVEMGYKVLTLSNLDTESFDLSPCYPNMYWPFGQHILTGAKIIRNNPALYAIYLTNHGCGPDTVLSHQFEKEMKGKPYLHIEVDEHSSEVGVNTRLEAFINSIDMKRRIFPETNKKVKNIQHGTQEDHKNRKLFIPNIFPYSRLLCELFKCRGEDVEVLPETTLQSFEKGKKFATSKEYISLVSLVGDVFQKAENNGSGKMSFWIPANEGSETSGQYENLVKNMLIEKGFDADVESPFLEDLPTDDSYGTGFFLMLLAGDIIMAAPPETREYNLQLFEDSIKKEKPAIELLKNFAREISGQNEVKKNRKKIFVLGEIEVLFNRFNNNDEIKKIEKAGRVFFQPVSETLYFMWKDYAKRSNNRILKEKLSEYKSCIKDVALILKESSPFDENPEALTAAADEKLGLFNGGHGRYRIARMLRCNKNMDGIVTMTSMYENTGIILGIIGDRYLGELEKPVLNLTYDGSSHINNEDVIDNFIYYL